MGQMPRRPGPSIGQARLDWRRLARPAQRVRTRPAPRCARGRSGSCGACGKGRLARRAIRARKPVKRTVTTRVDGPNGQGSRTHGFKRSCGCPALCRQVAIFLAARTQATTAAAPNAPECVLARLPSQMATSPQRRWRAPLTPARDSLLGLRSAGASQLPKKPPSLGSTRQQGGRWHRPADQAGARWPTSTGRPAVSAAATVITSATCSAVAADKVQPRWPWPVL